MLANAGVERSEDVVQMFRPGTGFGVGDGRPSKAEAEAAARTLLRWAGGKPTAIGSADVEALLAGTGAAYPATFVPVATGCAPIKRSQKR